MDGDGDGAEIISLHGAAYLAGYIRETWGTAERVDEYIEGQRWAITEWAETNGFRIYDWFIEVGLGGDVPWVQRPVLVQALLSIQAGNATGLITDRTDRAARDMLIAETVRHQVWKTGGRVYTASTGEIQRDQGSPELLAIRRTLDYHDQQELLLIRARRERGVAYARAQQRFHGGNPFYRPYGRRFITRPDGRKDYEAVPEEQDIIRELLRLREEEGYGWKRLTHWLNDNHIPTVSGEAPWAVNTVRIIVRRGLMPERISKRKLHGVPPNVNAALPLLRALDGGKRSA